MYDKGILSQKVADDIKKMIIEKDYRPGDKLPNELEMSKIINVSRSTIREAIKILVSTSILEVRRGKGTFVSETPGLSSDPLGMDFVEEENLLEHFFEMRLIIEPQMVKLAILRGKDEDFEDIHMAYEAVEKALTSGENHSLADIEFHNLIAKASCNPIMERIIPVINNGIQGGYAKTKDQPESAEVVGQQHRKIMKAIENRDPDAAYLAMKEHIEYGYLRSKQI